MLLGLEPGYPGQDDRLDRSILAAVLAILGAGMSFLLATLFLVFPDWISPRDFAIGVRTFVARMEVLSSPVGTDRAWAANRPVQEGQSAFTPGPLSDPLEGNLIQASGLPVGLLAEGGVRGPQVHGNGATSIQMDVRPSHSPERVAGKAVESLKEEIGGLEPSESPSANSHAAPDGPDNLSQPANGSSPGYEYAPEARSSGGYGPSPGKESPPVNASPPDKGKGKGSSSGKGP
jgi:hypothetical protein